MDTEEKKSVKVRIFGEEYPIRSDENPEYTKKVAEYVDSMMRHVNKGTKTSDAHTVAILAAMSITDELFRSRKGFLTLGDELKKRTSRILGFIDGEAAEDSSDHTA